MYAKLQFIRKLASVCYAQTTAIQAARWQMIKVVCNESSFGISFSNGRICLIPVLLLVHFPFIFVAII